MKTYKIYIDNSVYNRPFDDQRFERIYLEARAFVIILRLIEEKKSKLVVSFVNLFENHRNPDPFRKEIIEEYFKLASEFVELNEKIISKALSLTEKSLSILDALHVASADFAHSDFFITSDDGILKKSKKLKGLVGLKIVSVLEFLKEVL